jgi:hypothetical protein
MVVWQVCQRYPNMLNGGVANVPRHQRVLTDGVASVQRHLRVAKGGVRTGPNATNYSVVSRHTLLLHVVSVQKSAAAATRPSCQRSVMVQRSAYFNMVRWKEAIASPTKTAKRVVTSVPHSRVAVLRIPCV